MVTFHSLAKSQPYFSGGTPEPNKTAAAVTSKTRKTKKQTGQDVFHRTYIIEGGNPQEHEPIAGNIVRHIMKKDTAQKVQLRRSKSQKRLAIMTSKKNVDLKKYTFEDAENTVQKQPKRIMAQFLNSEPEIFQETLLAIIDLGNKTANELAKDMYDAYYSKKI